MTYTIIGIQPIQFSVEENEFNYGGFVAIDDAKCSACYHEPAFGIPYLTLLYKRSDYDSWDETPELNVVLRIGYPPTFRKGGATYGRFLAESGDKIMGDYARAVHSQETHDLVPICENLTQNLELYIKTGNYKVTWDPYKLDVAGAAGYSGYIDGSVAIGLDAHLENPKMVLLFNMREVRKIDDIYLLGIVATCDKDIGLYPIDCLALSQVLNLDKDALNALRHVIFSKGIPAREVYEAKRMDKGLPREPWSDI